MILAQNSKGGAPKDHGKKFRSRPAASFSRMVQWNKSFATSACEYQMYDKLWLFKVTSQATETALVSHL